jgi:hypothetical protein
MPKNTYTKETLYVFVKDFNAVLCDDGANEIDYDNPFYDNTTRDKIVYYKCIKCSCFSSKTHRRLKDTGPFCKKHIQDNRMTKIEKKYIQETGYKNPLCNPAVRQKAHDTNILLYGCQHPMQNKAVIDGMKKTIHEANMNNPIRREEINNKKKITYETTLGVDHPSKSDIIKKKKEDTNLKNRGVTYPAKSKEVLAKMAHTYTARTGYLTVSSNPEVRRKAETTNELRFGFKFPTQNPELMRKAHTNSFRFKEYTFPSGRKVQYMGYENFALNYILNVLNINEDDIQNEKLDRFIYRKPDEYFDRIYTPDIYIISQKKYIEVKSTWTILKDTENIFRKQSAVKNHSFECEIWVFNGKGNIVETYL